MSSLSKPRDAKSDPLDGFLYPTLILMIGSYTLSGTTFSHGSSISLLMKFACKLFNDQSIENNTCYNPTGSR